MLEVMSKGGLIIFLGGSSLLAGPCDALGLGQLTVYDARSEILYWACIVEPQKPPERTADGFVSVTTGSCAVSGSEARENSGVIVVERIQMSPEKNTAEAVIKFSDLRFGDYKRPDRFSGLGKAKFAKDDSGEWRLQSMETPVRTWSPAYE